MILIEQTCFCLPLRWGALGTFLVGMFFSIVPLTSLNEQIFKISFAALFLKMCHVTLGVLTSGCAIVGTLLKKPLYILPFISFYIGYAVIDLTSVIGTILIGSPFYAYNVLKGGKLADSAVSLGYLIQAILFFSLIFAARVYFILIVYSFYEEVKLSFEREGSSEISEEAAPLSISSKGSGKKSESEI